MARLKSDPHPSGRKGGRNKRFFPQLCGLKVALDRVIDERPDTSGVAPTDRRDEAQAKRDAKAARRAAAARRAGLLP